VSAFALNVSLTPLAICVASAAVVSPVVISGAVVLSGAVAGEAEAAASLIAAPVATCLDAVKVCRVSKRSVAVSRTILTLSNLGQRRQSHLELRSQRLTPTAVEGTAGATRASTMRSR